MIFFFSEKYEDHIVNKSQCHSYSVFDQNLKKYIFFSWLFLSVILMERESICLINSSPDNKGKLLFITE